MRIYSFCHTSTLPCLSPFPASSLPACLVASPPSSSSSLLPSVPVLPYLAASFPSFLSACMRVVRQPHSAFSFSSPLLFLFIYFIPSLSFSFDSVTPKMFFFFYYLFIIPLLSFLPCFPFPCLSLSFLHSPFPFSSLCAVTLATVSSITPPYRLRLCSPFCLSSSFLHPPLVCPSPPTQNFTSYVVSSQLFSLLLLTS